MKRIVCCLICAAMLIVTAGCRTKPQPTPAPESTVSRPTLLKKPVIYLYPTEPTEVTVRLSFPGTFTVTEPAYKNGWQVTARPDGTLADRNGQTYRYLYWEGIAPVSWDFSSGFCIAGRDTAAFLEQALASLGLTRPEADEFVAYWLPLMQKNKYNLISFQTDTYAEAIPLTVTPVPDTVIRVFMAYRPLESPVSVPEQILTAPERNGFTLVEWGGGLAED